MHADELDTSVDLVRSLLHAQHPDLADRSVVPVSSTGTSNAMYRLGEDLVVRLPLQPGSEASLASEHHWLPILGSQLPLPISRAMRVGEPTAQFPLPWSICIWFDGDDGTVADFDARQAASDLAVFLQSLRELDPSGAPDPATKTLGRGVPLTERDVYTVDSIDRCAHLYDPGPLMKIWQIARDTPVWHQPPCWVHGDIASGNLLFRDGRLSAVIDWSAMGAGDPAADLIVAWEMFDADSREVLRRELDVDDATWARSRGWSLSTAAAALYYYEHTNQFMFDQAMHKIEVLLNE